MKKLFGLLILCLLFSSGCLPKYHVFVNSINNGSLTNGKTCYIGSGNKDISVEDLTFKEFSVYVRKSLENRGYSVVDNVENADMLILLGYGIGNPQTHTSSQAMPTYGQTGVLSSTTYGTVNSYGSGFSTFTGTTNYTPTYGATGYVPVTRTNTTYTRYIKMTAYDWKAYKTQEKEVMLWDTDVVSTGTSGDLRRVFPVMIAGAIPYIGTDTGRKVKVILDENNKAVTFIKGLATE